MSSSEPLVVHTVFSQIEELLAGLEGRLEPGQLILYGPANYDEGAQIPFSVLYEDGTNVLSGMGTVTATADGGDERHPDARFDIVLEELQLDGDTEPQLATLLGVEFEASANDEVEATFDDEEVSGGVEEESGYDVSMDDDSRWSDGEATVGDPSLEDETEMQGDVDLGENPYAEQAAASDPDGSWRRSSSARHSASHSSSSYASSEYAAHQSSEYPRASLFPSEFPGATGPIQDVPAYSVQEAKQPEWKLFAGRELPEGQALLRSARVSPWWPAAKPQREPRPSSGVFLYNAQELPVPAHPPRPGEKTVEPMEAHQASYGSQADFGSPEGYVSNEYEVAGDQHFENDMYEVQEFSEEIIEESEESWEGQSGQWGMEVDEDMAGDEQKLE